MKIFINLLQVYIQKNSHKKKNNNNSILILIKKTNNYIIFLYSNYFKWTSLNGNNFQSIQTKVHFYQSIIIYYM